MRRPPPQKGTDVSDRLRAGPDISQRSNAATECREAFGECVELAPALGRGGWPESASKPAALTRNSSPQNPYNIADANDLRLKTHDSPSRRVPNPINSRFWVCKLHTLHEVRQPSGTAAL